MSEFWGTFQLDIPIKETIGTTVLLKGSAEPIISEQFSLDEIQFLSERAGFYLEMNERVEDLAYLCVLRKK